MKLPVFAVFSSISVGVEIGRDGVMFSVQNINRLHLPFTENSALHRSAVSLSSSFTTNISAATAMLIVYLILSKWRVI